MRQSVSTARCLGKPAKDVENHRLALEMEDLDLARRAIELVPHLGKACEPAGFGARRRDAGTEPVAHRVDEGRKRILVAPERIAECMQRARIDRGKRAEQRVDPLAYLQGAAAEQVERARDAAV